MTLGVLVAFFVGEYVLLPELASARRQLHRIGQLNFFWLALGSLLEVGALVAYAELTRTVLSPGAPDRFRVLRINMWALAISHTVPGGTVPATAASYRLLTESGVSGSTAANGLATQGIGSAVVLNLIFWLSLLISIPLQGYNPLYGFAAILGVLLLAAFAAVVYLLTRGERQAAHFVRIVAGRLPFVRAETVTSLVQKVADRMKILLTSSDLLVRGGAWAAANWLLDAASLWVFLLAFGTAVSPIDVLVAYGLANILASIPLTPSGLGVIELRRSPCSRASACPERWLPPESLVAPGQLLAPHPLRGRGLPLPAPGHPAGRSRGRQGPSLPRLSPNRSRGPLGLSHQQIRIEPPTGPFAGELLQTLLEAHAVHTGTRRQCRSGPSSQLLVSSAKTRSSTSKRRAWSSGSCTGTTTSIRRSRLRPMRSADPMKSLQRRDRVRPPGRRGAAEAVDPRMLQETADDGTHADVLGQLGDARPETAQARARPDRSGCRRTTPGRGRRSWRRR